MKTYLTMLTLTGMSWGVGSYTIVDAAMNSNVIGLCIGGAISLISACNFAYWQRGEKKVTNN